MILNRVRDYYGNDKKRLREKARVKYRNLSEEDKNKKREYGRNRYHNMSEKKKQRLKNIKKLPRDQKIKIKNLTFFTFHCIKHGTRSIVFWRKWHH